MRMRSWVAVVAAVAWAAGCNEEQTVGAASVPPTDAGAAADAAAPTGDAGPLPDAAVPDAAAARDGAVDGATGDGAVTACSTVAQPFAAGITAGAADASFLYGFGARDLRRVPLGGGAATVLVDGIDPGRAHALVVAGGDVWWVNADVGGSFVDAIMRAPAAGGAAMVVAWGRSVSSLVVADALYFVGEGALSTAPRGGGATVDLDRAAFVTGSGTLLAWVGPGDAFALHTRILSSPVAGRSLSAADTDGTSVFVALPTHELRRYFSDGTFTTIYRWTGTNNVALRVDDAHVYLAIGAGPLVRLTTDGTHADTLVPTVDLRPTFVLANNSVYFTVGPDTWRICK